MHARGQYRGSKCGLGLHERANIVARIAPIIVHHQQHVRHRLLIFIFVLSVRYTRTRLNACYLMFRSSVDNDRVCRVPPLVQPHRVLRDIALMPRSSAARNDHRVAFRVSRAMMILTNAVTCYT